MLLLVASVVAAAVEEQAWDRVQWKKPGMGAAAAPYMVGVQRSSKLSC